MRKQKQGRNRGACHMGLRFGDGVPFGPLSTIQIQSIGFKIKCVNLTGATPQQLPAAPPPASRTACRRRPLATRAAAAPPALHAVPQRSCSTPVPRTAAAPDPRVVTGFPVPYAAAALSRLPGGADSRTSQEKMEPMPRLNSAARPHSRGPCCHEGDGLGRHAATVVTVFLRNECN
jgi:hypothetical protein